MEELRLTLLATGRIGTWMKAPHAEEGEPPHLAPWERFLGWDQPALSMVYADERSYRERDLGGVIAVEDYDGCQALIQSVEKA